MATVNEKMTALADEIRSLTGQTGKLSLDLMDSVLNTANGNVIEQTELIEQIILALNSKLNPISTERLEGDGQEFYTTAPSTLSFRSTAPLNELQNIQINGETVDPSNYELEEGSTIVKLKHDYLSTFGDGQYELAVVSDSKTVKGNFTVTSPELNEYGFYYDLPYYADWEVSDDLGLDFGGARSAILLRNNGTASIYQIDSSNRYTTTYTYMDNTLILGFESDQAEPGTLTGTFTNNGKTIVGHIEAVGFHGLDVSGDADFEIIPNIIACDDYYVYNLFDSESQSYEYFPKTTTVTNYPAALNNIFGIPVITVAYEAFMNLDNFTSVTIPDSVTTIATCAFYNCSNLTNIIFEGTMEQWNAIEKGSSWNYHVPATHVQCSDGQVAL